MVVVTHYQIGAQIQTLSAVASASATTCAVEASERAASHPTSPLSRRVRVKCTEKLLLEFGYHVHTSSSTTTKGKIFDILELQQQSRCKSETTSLGVRIFLILSGYIKR